MKRRQHPRAVLPALVLCLIAAAAMLVSPAASSQGGRRPAEVELAQVLSSFDRLSLDPAELLKGARRDRRVTLETSRGTFDLEVEPFEIRGENYRAVAIGEGGRVTELPRTPSRAWRGKVSGTEETYVRLVLDGDNFAGIIVTPSETYFVEQARNLTPAAGAKEFLFYAESSVTAQGGECGTTMAEKVNNEVVAQASRLSPPGGKSDDPTAAEAFAPKPETEVATEADFEFFQQTPSGGAAGANAEILGIMTQVDAIYEAQINVKIRVVFQRVWETNTDPYTLTDAADALNQFRTTYNQSFAPGAPPARDITHMFTGKNFDGSTIGIAFIGAVCAAPNFAYGISQSRFSGIMQRRVAVTAHEIGHNFGAAHPDDELEIDPTPSDCITNSIMNSTVQDTQNFCQFSRDQITSHVTEFGSCLARLAPAGCSYQLTSPTTFFFSATGGTGSVGVNTSQANCDWALAEGVDWIGTTAAGVGPGGGTFNVAPNTNTAARETTLDVAGQSIIVRQAASPACVVGQLSPGQTATGTLATTDCRVSQPGHPNAPADLYTFTARAGQRIRIEMLAEVRASDTPPEQDPPPAALDCFVYLFGPGGTIVTANDDRSSNPHDTDSSVPTTGFLTLPTTGVYTIAATAFDNYDNGNYTLRLLDNASANSVTLSSAAYSVDEGTSGGIGVDGTGLRVVTVTRSGDTTGTATVDFATADGTASRQSDYIQTLGTLVFGPGQTSKTFTVFVPDDAFQEAPETVQITLSNPVGTTLGATQTATLTINSNDSVSGPSPVRPESFNAAFFVRQHYLDFFSREPDASGFGFWQGQTTNCGNPNLEVCRINVSAAFFQSIEFQNTGYLVYRTYKAAYGDATSPGVPGTVPVVRLNEFLADTQRIGQGVIVNEGPWEALLEANKQAFALEFVLRPRFITAFPLSMTPAQFVDKLNQNAGFVLTTAERDALVNQLNTTADNSLARAAVLRAVAENAALRTAEFRRAFVLMQYYGYLRRNPDDAPEPGLNFGGWNFWLGKLNEFNGNFIQAEMVKAFLDSSEYRGRFGQ